LFRAFVAVSDVDFMPAQIKAFFADGHALSAISSELCRDSDPAG